MAINIGIRMESVIEKTDQRQKFQMALKSGIKMIYCIAHVFISTLYPC